FGEMPRAEQNHACARDHRREVAQRHEDETQQQAENDAHGQSVIAIARSAMRSRAESFSVALFSCPQAARMSRPRGVRTGDEYPALKMYSENFSILSQSEHSYVVPGQG